MKRFGSQLSCRISSDMLRRAPISRAYALVGKLVWKSLKTATFSVAKQRLLDTLRDHRSKIESLTAFAEGKADCVADCIGTSADFKPILAQILAQNAQAVIGSPTRPASDATDKDAFAQPILP